ncbi:MAG: DMT family transporter, partial [Bacteroidales bacterium]|nr:DMT family transporter [Bacteroidales bacterium]
MWLWMTLGSALMLGIYDVFKKQALKNNSVLWVLLAATALSTLFLSPFLSSGPVEDHLRLVLKAVLVTTSWVSGLIGLKLLPITTVSTLKASRPFFVVLFSIVLFGEQLNGWQWAGVALALLALTLLSGASKKEGIDFSKSKGV